MSETIFTKIINREIPGEIIYEDDDVAAFFTIEPVHIGHTLIVPKQPFENIFDGDPIVLGKMMHVAQRVAQALQTVTGAEGVNLQMNNGAIAGQEVWHAHLHIFPRVADDEAVQIKTQENDQDAAHELAEQLRNAL